MQEYGACADDIDTVLLAGAFGSAINPVSACRTHLLPNCLLPKIRAVGNAAGSGAKLLACDREAAARLQAMADSTELVELASEPSFPGTFARCMNFPV